MKKTFRIIAMILVMILLSNCITSCIILTPEVYAIPVINIFAGIIDISLAGGLIYAVIMLVTGLSTASTKQKADRINTSALDALPGTQVDTLTRKVLAMPEAELISFVEVFDAKPQEETIAIMDKLNALPKADLYRIAGYLNTLSGGQFITLLRSFRINEAY